jgi:hypothetical protein
MGFVTGSSEICEDDSDIVRRATISDGCDEIVRRFIERAC